MAKKLQPQPEPRMVRCCDCRLFQRDTEGISFSAQTGEYFMGICPKGHTDGYKKVFADKARECNDFTK